MEKKLEGIVAPMASALTAEERIDEKRTRSLVDFLIEGGIDALFPRPHEALRLAVDIDLEREVVLRLGHARQRDRDPSHVGLRRHN